MIYLFALLKKTGQITLPCFSVFILAAAVLGGCAGPDKPIQAAAKNSYEIYGKTYQPIDSASGFRQQGVASWYGRQFHAKKTANGETYDMYAMTAAHKTLPFGTMVEVKNVETGKSVIVRINDRGPFCRDRIIDLSFCAAEKIGMIRNGTAAVEVTALGKDDAFLKASDKSVADPVYFTGDFTIQAGSFTNAENAENLKKSLEKVAQNVCVASFEKNGRIFYRVRVGRFTSLTQARHTEAHLIENGFKNVYTVAWDL